jgi:hypothetical protein
MRKSYMKIKIFCTVKEAMPKVIDEAWEKTKG